MGGRRYTDEEIELGLRVLAQYNGSGHNASITLEKAGAMKVHSKTLVTWRDRFPDRYAKIREEELPKVRARAGETHMQIAARATELAAKTLDEVEEELPKLKGREIADTLLKLSTVAGIHTDKAQALAGAPTAIVEHRTLKDLLRGLERKGVIEVDAEVIDATPDTDPKENARGDAKPAQLELAKQTVRIDRMERRLLELTEQVERKTKFLPRVNL